jgi:16S rRNA (cytosine967-C5)-methyltransferase
MNDTTSEDRAGQDGGLPARQAALALIDAAMGARAGIDVGIAEALGDLGPRERAFARSLAMTTLRRWGQIERILAARMHKPPPVEVAALMRIGVAQALFMEVADHAAVATTVSLAQTRQETRPFKPLINGVLRGMLREPPELRDEDLAPDWLLARWRAAYGYQTTALCAEIANEPPTDLSLRDPADGPALAEALEGQVLPGGTLRSALRGDIASWPSYEDGSWWVQDAAAAIPVRLLNLKPEDTALDLCAAPGGKTMQMAAAGAVVVALDRSASRTKRVTENLTRTGLEAEVVIEPAETWTDERTFDAVLVDAPCSATGTFRRQPEVLWLAKPQEIAKLAMVQARLLDTAGKRVKAGGVLVYCTCSLEPEEGEAQATAFLKRNPGFKTAPAEPGEGGAPAVSLTPEGWLRILPNHMAWGLDGFFIARFVRAD